MARANRFLTTLTAGLVFTLAAGCGLFKSDKVRAPATSMAQGARTVAVTTARAGALVSKLIASKTYRGSRRAITWTGARTADGTAATLERLGLIERPVPQDVVETLPDELLKYLHSLEFVSAIGAGDRIVISSPDLRWEGEVFYRVDTGHWIEVEVEGPSELIAVTMACFSPENLKESPEVTLYTVHVQEDNDVLGEVSFEGTASEILQLYGYQDWLASGPGVFVVKTLKGIHRYRFQFERTDCGDPLMVSFFLPRYE